jgi:hypothetical protein
VGVLSVDLRAVIQQKAYGRRLVSTRSEVEWRLSGFVPNVGPCAVLEKLGEDVDAPFERGVEQRRTPTLVQVIDASAALNRARDLIQAAPHHGAMNRTVTGVAHSDGSDWKQDILSSASIASPAAETTPSPLTPSRPPRQNPPLR